MQQTNPASGGDALLPLRTCNTTGCKVATVVEKTKRKCSQFVSAPYIMPKPLVVNGHTSIFQVGGEMAHMGDIPALSKISDGGQLVYRIKPGTHAYVINYVIIDEGSDSLEKARSGDQEAMRLLLESQRDSAASKLQKFLTNHKGTPPSGYISSLILSRPVASVSTSAGTPAATGHVTTPQIHPNFSIASVEGAVPFRRAVPPLAVNPSAPAPVPSGPLPAVSAVQADSVDRLQAELVELRRTVARLEENSRR
uniref:RE28931p n=1 Tax=Drosophila melanogaster TaxID=7227 RepID=Q8MZ05_DROME|nr:RE28931p [Drosophila melanogaster]